MLIEDTSRLKSIKMQFYHSLYSTSERWDGTQPLENKNVIIYGEQGLGDQIQFFRYVPVLKSRYNCNIILQCDKPLHRLLDTVKSISSLIDKESESLPNHDYHILSMSLPFILQDALAPCCYLKDITPNEEVCKETEYFKIGIAWEGNKQHSNNNERCCELYYFYEIQKAFEKINLPVKFYLLQNEFQKTELVRGAESFDLYGIDLTDMMDTACLIQALDAVVTVDTAVLHLSSTIGKPTWGALSHRHDPRWDVRKWYDTLTLVTQPHPGDWKYVFQQIADGLIKHIKI